MQIFLLSLVSAALLSFPSCTKCNVFPQVENKDAILSEVYFPNTIAMSQDNPGEPKPPEIEG